MVVLVLYFVYSLWLVCAPQVVDSIIPERVLYATNKNDIDTGNWKQPSANPAAPETGQEMKFHKNRHPSEGRLGFVASINTDTAIHKVDPRFVSTGVSVRHTSVNIVNSSLVYDSTILKTLAKGLSPAVFRVGGRSADETVFLPEFSGRMPPRVRLNGASPAPVIDNVVSGDVWKRVNEFTTRTGLDLLFGLNVIFRRGESWDPTNAKELFDYNAKLGYKVMWELGNEPELFIKNYGFEISPSQLAKDFVTLRQILSDPRYHGFNTVVGPDNNHLALRSEKMVGNYTNARAYLETFLENVDDAINATTVHFYNIHNRPDTSIVNFTDPDVLDEMVVESDKFSDLMRKLESVGSSEMWYGESSVCSDGGFGPASARYVAGFGFIG